MIRRLISWFGGDRCCGGYTICVCKPNCKCTCFLCYCCSEK